MIWYICFFAALAVGITAAAMTAVTTVRRRRDLKIRKSMPIWFGSCYSMALLLSLPPYILTYQGDHLQWLKVLFYGIRMGFKLFAGEALGDLVMDVTPEAPDGLVFWYELFALVLQFVASLLSITFALSFIRNLSATIAYKLSYFRDTYVFSEPNKRSVTLAQDIHKHHPDVQIVFAGVQDNGGEWKDALRDMSAIRFRKDICSINFRFRHPEKELRFFVMDNDEMVSVDKALKLIDTYRDREKSRLYVFCTGVEGELLLSAKDKGKMKVRRVNEDKSLIYRILYEEGHTLFENAIPIPDTDQKQISAVILGLGSRGTEMLKALSWYCQMDGYKLKINAFDASGAARDLLAAQCPELLEMADAKPVPGQGECQIHIHGGCNVNTRSFQEKLSEIKDATYVFISLGSEEANIKAAVDVRMLFEREGAKPVIHAVLTGSKAKAGLSNATNFAGQPYNIYFVGDPLTSYSENVILHSAVEKEAFERHCSYCNGDAEKIEDFWRYEYCYSSSMAATIHDGAKKLCGISGASKKVDEQAKEERDVLEDLEHRRWNVYMRSEGYIYSGSPEKASRNDLAKKHHNLIPFAQLSDEDKRKDSRVAAKVDGE